MRIQSRFFTTCIVVCMFFLQKCSVDHALFSDTSGSGTQTTNGVCVSKVDNVLIGYVFHIDSDGSPKALHGKTAITLQLLSSDFHPYDGNGFNKIAHLDSACTFVFDSLQNGYYNLIATDTLDSTSLIFQALPVFDSIDKYSKSVLLAASGAIEGVINDTSSVHFSYRGAYIPGTPFFSLADSAGAFRLFGVPAGSYVIKADYFSKTRGTGYTRIKGIMQGLDTLTIYSDSVKVIVSPDSVLKSLNLSL